MQIKQKVSLFLILGSMNVFRLFPKMSLTVPQRATKNHRTIEDVGIIE